jgi:hypothetical protein
LKAILEEIPENLFDKRGKEGGRWEEKGRRKGERVRLKQVDLR